MENSFLQGKTPNFTGEILLCEDNEINQHFIKSHLGKLGFDLVIASNGLEGVNIVSERLEKGQKAFDLIFMDIQMPVMDGIEAVRKIAAMGVKTPVVALSANSEPDDRELYEQNGMAGSLSKQFAAEELWECLYKFFTPISYEQANELKQAAENEKRRERLFKGFVRRNKNTYNDICSAINVGDIKLAHRLAHTLRGLAGLMEKKDLQQAAASVESALASGDSSGLDLEMLERMGRELDTVLEELSGYLDTSACVSTSELDKNTARCIFDKLEPLLRANSAQCRKTTEELAAIPGTGALITFLDDYEFEDALTELASLRSSLGI